MAIPELVSALKNAIRIWTFAPSTGGNYMANQIHTIDVRFDTNPPCIRIDTMGVAGLARSRAVEGSLSFAAVDALFDLKNAYIDRLNEQIREHVRVLLDEAAEDWAVRSAKSQLRQLLGHAAKLETPG